MNTDKNTARFAGLIYLGVIIFGVFAEYVRSVIFITGDAAATVNNIISMEFLFKMGFFSDLIMMTLFLFLGLVLWRLLRPVNRNRAYLMAIIVAVSIPINMLNLLNQFHALLLVKNIEYLEAFNISQLQSEVMMSFSLYKNGYLIAQIFFGLWLLPLGLLVYKSEFLPRPFGILLIAGCFSHLADMVLSFLMPEYPAVVSVVVYLPASIAEVSFCLWLLIRGLNPSKIKPEFKESAYV